MKKAIVFARVSSEGQTKGASLDQQVEAGLAYAARTGMEVVEVFREEGVSGAARYTDRPLVVEMLAMAERGEIQAVIWFSQDRQGRDGLQASLIEQELSFYGVEPHFTTIGHLDDESMEGIMLGGMGKTFAEVEKHAIKNRSARGRYGKALEGQWPSAKAPLGYRNVKHRAGLVIDEAGAEVIRFAYQRILAGDTIEATAAALQAKFPTRRFPASTVTSWLRKSYYTGTGIERWVAPAKAKTSHDGKTCKAFMQLDSAGSWHCTECRACKHENAAEVGGRLQCPNCGRTRFIIEAPQIITPEQFEQARRAIALNPRSATNKARKPNSVRAYALTMRLEHQHDDDSLEAMTGFYRGDFRAYRCHRAIQQFRLRNGGPECHGWGSGPRNGLPLTSVRAGYVEASAIIELLARLESPEAILALQEKEDRRQEAISGSRLDLASLTAAIASIESERKRALEQNRKGWLDDGELEGILADLGQRRTLAEADKARIENASEALEGARVTFDDLMKATIETLDPREVSPADGDAWKIAVNALEQEALRVQRGDVKDLGPVAQDWLMGMVARFDVRGRLVEEDGKVVIKFDGDRDLFGAPSRQLATTQGG